MATATPQTVEISPARSAARGFLLIFGSLSVLIALGLLSAGGALLWAHQTQRDDSGFFTTGENTIATSGHAIASNGFEAGTPGPDLLFSEGRLGTVRLSASASSEPIFLGIAPQRDLQRYLAASSYSVVTDFELDPFSIAYSDQPGGTTPAPPLSQDFWVASTVGSGTQSLTWPVDDGRWAAVLMNADGSPAVVADVSVAAKAGWIVWLATGLLAGGALAAVVGGTLIYMGGRRSRSGGTSAA